MLWQCQRLLMTKEKSYYSKKKMNTKKQLTSQLKIIRDNNWFKRKKKRRNLNVSKILKIKKNWRNPKNNNSKIKKIYHLRDKRLGLMRHQPLIQKSQNNLNSKYNNNNYNSNNNSKLFWNSSKCLLEKVNKSRVY